MKAHFLMSGIEALYWAQQYLKEEREKILFTDVVNPAKTLMTIYFCRTILRRIVILSLKSGGVTTDYARKQGAWFLDEDCEDKNKGSWWLRYYGLMGEDEEEGE